MDDSNPFRPNEPARKRIVGVSVTKSQMDAIDALQKKHRLESRSAVVKLALAELLDRNAVQANGGETR